MLFYKKLTKDKIIVIFIRISLLIAILGGIYESNWISLLVTFITLILSFIPKFFIKKYNINLPSLLQIFIIFFIYFSLFLGEVKSFYIKFWWWDSFLHLFSGIALGFAGFLIMYILYKTDKIKTNPILVSILSFCFALSICAIWEIFEFGMDKIFNLNMQKSKFFSSSELGLKDTMIDLIMGTFGALFSSISGYIFIKTKRFPFFGNIFYDFKKQNKKLFKN